MGLGRLLLCSESNVAAADFERADAAPAERTDEDALLEQELAQQLAQAGFEPVDAAAMRQRLAKFERQADRFVNPDHLARALEDDATIDLLLVAQARPAVGDGQRRYNAQLVDLRTVAKVAFQSFPDGKWDLHPEFRVAGGEAHAASLARYLAGNLLVKYDARLEDDRFVTEVQVRNVTNLEQVNRIIGSIRNDIRVIDEVRNVKISVPISGFEITYRGTPDDVLLGLQQQLTKLGVGAFIDAAGGNQIVVNLLRQIKPEAVAAGKPGADKPGDAAAGAARAPGLDKAVRDAQQSVSAVGLLLANGKFVPLGTAWTVGDKRLATNAHVVEAIRDSYAKYPDATRGAKTVARRGPKLAHELTIGEMRVHPGYDAWARIVPSNSEVRLIPGFDVALLDVTAGDAGRPLPLATDEQILQVAVADPVAFTGFPTENVSNVASKPAIRADIGTLSAVTDVFFQAADPKDLRILHYNLVLTGGSSGSPVLNASGRVIGINSAGDVSGVVRFKLGASGEQEAEVARIGTGYNYGQRTDMLKELLDGTAEGLQPSREAEWRRFFAAAAATGAKSGG